MTEEEDFDDEWKVFMKLKKYNVWRKKLNSNGKYMYKSEYQVFMNN